MSGSIFTINESTGELHSMPPTPFATEDDFQALLERYPRLLTSDAFTQGAPRRWILLEREKGVSVSIGATPSLSLDHLYVDQDGIPTLVEVKRAENRELRREVVAQMLDYAANAVAFWPPDGLRSQFERDPETHPVEKLAEELGISSAEVDDFWGKVEANLRAGKIRMLFVADRIPSELKRIVEFLNEQMNPAEVLALELQQFVAEGLRTIVPVVFGKTERVGQIKRESAARRSLGVPELLAKIQALVSNDVAVEIASLAKFSLVAPYNIRVSGNSMFMGCRNKDGDLIEPFALAMDGKIWAQLDDGHMKMPFDDTSNRARLSERLRVIEGLNFTRSPQFPTSPLASMTARSVAGLRDLLGWVRAICDTGAAMP